MQDTTIAFGTFFSRQNASVGRNVSIGSYCVIGHATIGEGSQISSHVQIPSGKQTIRRIRGSLPSGVEGEVQIGSYCFIAASAVVLANVATFSTIGAGSVVGGSRYPKPYDRCGQSGSHFNFLKTNAVAVTATLTAWFAAEQNFPATGEG